MFRQKQKNFHTTTVVVKGCEWECARVKEATLLLMDNLCTGLSLALAVSCRKLQLSSLGLFRI